MSKIYNINNELLFEDENLSLKELVEKNKKDLEYADLKGTDLTNANLRFTDLTGADLTNANLRFTDLTGADLTNANLEGVDLRGANLDFAIYSSETVWLNGKTLGELIKKEAENVF